MNFWLVVIDLNHIPQQRTPRNLRQLLQMRTITFHIAGRERHLHKPFVTPREHARERFAGFVVHHVGHHRRAIEIHLDAGGAGRWETLR